ncbi:hypothetical protein BGZ73_002369 [Actinomortierella ambigua]|nr:hypothetical protein BGZ73_002369 [Actinomortierella ambigua]
MPYQPSGPASRMTQGQAGGQGQGQHQQQHPGSAHAPQAHAHAQHNIYNTNTPQHLQPSAHSYCIPTQHTLSSATQDTDSNDAFSNFSDAYAAGISIPTAAFNTARFGELELEGSSGTGSHPGLTGKSGIGGGSAAVGGGRVTIGSGITGSSGLVGLGGGVDASNPSRTRRIDELDDDDDDFFGMEIDSNDFDDDFDNLPDAHPTQFPPSVTVSTQDGPGAGGGRNFGNAGGAGRVPNQVMTQPAVVQRAGAAGGGGGGLSGASNGSGTSSSSSSYFVVAREEQALKEQIAKLQQKNSEMETQIKEKEKEITMRTGENIMLRQDRDKFRHESERLLELNKNTEIRHAAEVDQIKKTHQRHVESLKMDHQFEIQNVVSRPTGARLAAQSAQVSEGPSASQFALSQSVRPPTQRAAIAFPASQQQAFQQQSFQQQPSPSQFGRSFSSGMLTQKPKGRKAGRDTTIPLESFGSRPNVPPATPRPMIPTPTRAPDRGRPVVPTGMSAMPLPPRRPILPPRPTASEESSVQKILLTTIKGSRGLRKLGALGVGALNLHYRHVPGSENWTKFAKLERLNQVCVEALLQLTVHVSKETTQAALEATFATLREAILLRQSWMMAQLVSVLVALLAQPGDKVVVQDWICADERTKTPPPFFARVMHHRFLHKPRTEDPLETVREALKLCPSGGAETTDSGALFPSTTSTAMTSTAATASGAAPAATGGSGGGAPDTGGEMPAPAQEMIPTPLSCIFYLLALLALAPPRMGAMEGVSLPTAGWTMSPTFAQDSASSSSANSPSQSGLLSSIPSSVASPLPSTLPPPPPPSRSSIPPAGTAPTAVPPPYLPCVPTAKHSAVSLSATRATIDMTVDVAAYECEVLQLVEQTVAALVRHGKRSLVYPLLHLRILEAVLMSRPQAALATPGGMGGHVCERTMAIFLQLAQDPECCRVLCGGSIYPDAGSGSSSGSLVFEGSTHLVDVLSRQLLLTPPDPRRPSSSSLLPPATASSSLSSRLQLALQLQQQQQQQGLQSLKMGGVAGAVLFHEQAQAVHWWGACPQAKKSAVKILRALTRVNRGQTHLLVMRTGMVLHCVEALREQIEVCLAYVAQQRSLMARTRTKPKKAAMAKVDGALNVADKTTAAADARTKSRRRSLAGGARGQGDLMSRDDKGVGGADDVDKKGVVTGEEGEDDDDEEEEDDEGYADFDDELADVPRALSSRGGRRGRAGGMECDAHSVVLYLLTFLNSLEGAVMSSNAWLERTYPDKVAELASCASIVAAHRGLQGLGHSVRASGGASHLPPLQGIHLDLETEARQMLVWIVNDEQKEEERVTLAK